MRALALLALCLSTLIASCASDDRERKFVARDVGALYNLGKDYLERGRYSDAAIFFDEVERQHPYSQWARRAQLMSAYANYKGNKYDDAVLSAERFLTLHPGNSETDYAYYIIAICHYERIIDVSRDQKMTQRALQALREVERRFPESEYAEDARLKIDMTRDHLAGKEMEVGRFYQRRGQHLAAIGRFKTVVDDYDTTSHTPEALHRMTESFLSLGIKAEARKSAATLGYNYPGSKWYRYSYDLIQDKG